MGDYLDEPLSPQEATEKIREIARFGTVTPSKHCWRDSMRNRGFDFQDLLMVLRNGTVTKPPEQDRITGDYKYVVEGYALDDEEVVRIVTVIVSHRELSILTVF